MSGWVVAVTGAGSGLGEAACHELRELGARIGVLDIDSAAARRVARDLGGASAALPVPCDVRSAEQVDAAVARVAAELGGLDGLVNNAGIIGPEPSAEVTDGAFAGLVDVHLTGAMRCARAAYPYLCESDAAAVVNIASIAAHVGIPLRASYCAAKAGLEGLTRCLATEWAAAGVRVNAVAPGYIGTPMVLRAFEDGVTDADAILPRVPLRRLGEPREVGAVVAFLASAKASFVTGQVLVVDGGLVSNGSW